VEGNEVNKKEKTVGFWWLCGERFIAKLSKNKKTVLVYDYYSEAPRGRVGVATLRKILAKKFKVKEEHIWYMNSTEYYTVTGLPSFTFAAHIHGLDKETVEGNLKQMKSIIRRILKKLEA
jgi:hypothetical protein